MEPFTLCLLCYSSVLTMTSICSYYFVSHTSEYIYTNLEENLKSMPHIFL